MKNFSHQVQGEHFKIRGSMNGRVRNSIENWPYLKNGERYGQG